MELRRSMARGNLMSQGKGQDVLQHGAMPAETRSQLRLPVPGFLCTSPVPTLTAQTIKIN